MHARFAASVSLKVYQMMGCACHCLQCKEVRMPDGGWAYRGPRVRMGIHWANEGSAVQAVHVLTKHTVYTGET